MIIISALNCGVYSRTVFNRINMVITLFIARAITELFCCRLNTYGVAPLFNKHRFLF